MLNVLDVVLRDLFLSRIAQLTDESQVGFDPPDDTWRAHVATLSVGGNPANALNVYLVDLVENRKLRSNERIRTVNESVVFEQPAPALADCHYLVSAWSPATATPAVAPTLDEHALLYEALATLEQNAPINPSRVYPPGSAPLAAIPELIRDRDLPTAVGHEGFPKLPEFWGTMGTNHRWKPAIHVVVTLPVALLAAAAGPIVTTRITEYRVSGVPGSAETWIQIGGTVVDASVAPAVPVAGAWVQIELAAGGLAQDTRTNALGRYSFGWLRSGSYLLRYRAEGFAVPPPRAVDVPSLTGEYDLEFP
jgi:hypothetical protein